MRYAFSSSEVLARFTVILRENFPVAISCESLRVREWQSKQLSCEISVEQLYCVDYYSFVSSERD